MTVKTRRTFCQSVLVALCSLFGLVSSTSCAPSPKRMDVYIGTYTGGESKGIYLLDLDLVSGEISDRGLVAEVASPSFLAIHPSKDLLYAVGELGEYDGEKNNGAIHAYRIDPESGKLTLINSKSSRGAHPCHIVVDPSGKTVLVANYSGGNVSSVRLNEDGSLREKVSVYQHEGSSVNPGRQKAPHAHSINVDPSKQYAMAADLGADKIFVYKLDAEKGELTPHDPPSVSTPPGGGPRHFAFHPSGRFAFTNNEMQMSITSFKYDASRGVLEILETVPTLPEEEGHGKVSGNSTAEIQVHPNGQFLYCSNRGHHSIVVYAINQETGKLTYIETESTQGKTPRNFGIDPTGTYLLAANQGSSDVVVFRINPQSGELDATGHKFSVPTPVCVKFIPR